MVIKLSEKEKRLFDSLKKKLSANYTPLDEIPLSILVKSISEYELWGKKISNLLSGKDEKISLGKAYEIQQKISRQIITLTNLLGLNIKTRKMSNIESGKKEKDPILELMNSTDE